MRAPWEELEPASRSAVERQRHAVGRVEHLAAVTYATALALLVWSTLGPVAGSVTPDSSVAAIVRSLWPAAGCAALGLLALLSCWLLHHLQLTYLTRSSGTLLCLHALLLPAVLSVPLSVNALSAAAFSTATALVFTANVLSLELVLLLIWRQAVRGGLLFGGDVPSRVVTRIRLLLRFSVVLVLASVGASQLQPIAGLLATATLLLLQILAVVRGGYLLDLKARTAHPT
jgi:uncharacterized membrane protein